MEIGSSILWQKMFLVWEKINTGKFWGKNSTLREQWQHGSDFFLASVRAARSLGKKEEAEEVRLSFSQINDGV